MRNVSRRNLLGLPIQDCYGQDIGHVVDTWPEDGGWEMELVVVRLPRFGERRMLPVEELFQWFGVLQAPFTRVQIEDGPLVGEGKHRADDPYRAMAYWRFEDRGDVAIVTRPWRRSSGSYATVKPFPTSPRPTPTAS
jgi:hypothetical protein